MITINRIVCPTDFSESSYKAVRAASDVAIHFAAELMLVHVVSPVPLPSDALTRFDVPAYEEQLKKDAEQSLKDACAANVPSELHAQLVVRRGNPWQEIVKAVDESNVDLLVVATHGMTGLRHYMHGSVAQKVIQHTRCPILVIRGVTDSDK